MRFCLKDATDARLPISLWRNKESGEPTTPLLMDVRRDLHKFLPTDDVLTHLQGNRKEGVDPPVTCKGLRLCPVPLTWATGLREALQWQADLDAWGAMPFDGPTSSWPAGTLDLLRHVRGMNGILQARKWDRQAAEE